MIQAIYPGCDIEPSLVAPRVGTRTSYGNVPMRCASWFGDEWKLTGPITAEALSKVFQLPFSEIQEALFALEAEGFILRGKFHPGATEIEWCDRRLLARIHRLTINRLRAEIQPVSIAEYQRFLLAWQRVDAEHRGDRSSMASKPSWSCWTDASCRQPRGNPKCSHSA